MSLHLELKIHSCNGRKTSTIWDQIMEKGLYWQPRYSTRRNIQFYLLVRKLPKFNVFKACSEKTMFSWLYAKWSHKRWVIIKFAVFSSRYSFWNYHKIKKVHQSIFLQTDDGKNLDMDSEPGSNPIWATLNPVWSWATYLTPFSLMSLTCKMGSFTFTWWGHCEIKWENDKGPPKRSPASSSHSVIDEWMNRQTASALTL